MKTVSSVYTLLIFNQHYLSIPQYTQVLIAWEFSFFSPLSGLRGGVRA